MQNKDTFFILASKLDNPTLQRLSLLPQYWQWIREFSSNQNFWRLRVQSLMGGREFRQDLGTSWKEAYRVLLPVVGKIRDMFTSEVVNNPLAVAVLLESGVDPSMNSGAAIVLASAEGSTEVVKLLLSDSRVDPSVFANAAIREASSRGHAEVVRLLLEDGRADPTDADNLAIENAASNGHAEVVRLLLEDGRADPTVDENLPLKQAAHGQYLEVVKLLLEDGRADPTVGNNQILLSAVQRGRAELVKILLSDNRFNSNAVNRALQLVPDFYPEVARILLADPRADPAADNSRVLTVVANEGRSGIVKLLLEDGRADPQVIADDIISTSIFRGSTGLKVIEALLQDPRTEVSYNTLVAAVKSGNVEAVRLLLNHESVKLDDGGEYIVSLALSTGIPKLLTTVLASDKVDLQSIGTDTMLDLLDIVSSSDYIVEGAEITRDGVSEPIYLDKLITNDFERDHYLIFLRELILKKNLDLKYFFRWLVEQCKRHPDAVEYRELIGEAGESFYDTGIVVHTSPLFTAYSGFLLLAKSSNTRAILNTLKNEGASQEGLQLASMLIRAYLR